MVSARQDRRGVMVQCPAFASTCADAAEQIDGVLEITRRIGDVASRQQRLSQEGESAGLADLFAEVLEEFQCLALIRGCTAMVAELPADLPEPAQRMCLPGAVT
jgi:hypothetical protein